ncbi:hypothetical protein [Tautonia plasticadhaerens]
MAADSALIPTMPELFGAQGLAEVRDWVTLSSRPGAGRCRSSGCW